MKIIYTISIFAAAMATVLSCSQDLLDKAPYDKVSSGNMWTTESNADFGVGE